jgi:hypothetical protein
MISLQARRQLYPTAGYFWPQKLCSKAASAAFAPSLPDFWSMAITPFGASDADGQQQIALPPIAGRLPLRVCPSLLREIALRGGRRIAQHFSKNWMMATLIGVCEDLSLIGLNLR